MGCEETDIRKLIQFSAGVPVITQGSTTLIEVTQNDLGPFFQVIDTYQVETISVVAGASASVGREMNFIMANVLWPAAALESEKKVELQISDFDYGNVFTGGTGTIGSTGATVTGATTSFVVGFTGGDRIESGGQIRIVDAVGSTVSLTTTVAFSPAITTGATFSKVTYNTTLGATAQSIEKFPIKELFLVNSVENHKHLKFTNLTAHDITISLLTAKS